MIRRLAALTLAGSLLALGTVAADGDAECFAHVDGQSGEETGTELCTTPVWFHTTRSPAGNLDTVTGSPATFDTTEPTGSGAGFLTTSALHQQSEPYDRTESATFVGTFEGPIDNVLTTLYLVPPAGVAQGETTYRVDALLRVNGTDVAMLGDTTVPLEASGNLWKISFGWKNLLKRVERTGDLAGPHEVELVFHGTGIATSAAAVFFDHPDAPSGMVFNVAGELDSAFSRA